ncbi:MAG: DUF4114 domain-containing protein [Phycisphaerae bacterium]|jgi:hypothetical protein|nr:DUF4114 domain-containing protein [Phycisphaerae bacterium]
MKAIAVIGVLLMAVTSAYADPYSNTRPIVPLGDNGIEDNLQEVFNSITVSGGIDAIADQTPFAVFGSDASGGSVATMIIELAANPGTNTFGIYDVADPTNLAEVFSGAQGQGAQAIIAFMANGDIRVNGAVAASNFGSMFGFYLGVPRSTFYSQDVLNPGGNAQALVYQGDGSSTLQIPGYTPGRFTKDEYIIAFEEVAFDESDKDFQDMVVMVESITPVPLPGAALIGLLGFSMIGWIKRRLG